MQAVFDGPMLTHQAGKLHRRDFLAAERADVVHRGALVHGGTADKARQLLDPTYAGVTERRTELGLPALSIRLSTVTPTMASVRCAASPRARSLAPMIPL